MSSLIRHVFPTLTSHSPSGSPRWSEVRLNDLHIKHFGFPSFTAQENPCLDPVFCQHWIEYIHRRLGVDFSHGGWLEDRQNLWRGHYHPPGHTIHLGIDFNVPEGTPVSVPAESTLMHSEYDPDPNGGWGGKLVFEHRSGFYILGHLRKLVTDRTRVYLPGDVVGVVAGPAENGGWYPHLHLQCTTNLDLRVDGYAVRSPDLYQWFPHPFEVFARSTTSPLKGSGL